MPSHEYLEDLSSLLPAVHLLANVGYEYISPLEANKSRNNKLNQVVLEDILEKQIRKLNSITFKEQQYDFSDDNIKKAVQSIAQIPFDSLIKTNEDVFDLLTLGKSLEQTINGYTRSYSLKYIDWEHIENNVFHVTDEFEVEKRHSHQTRRPDVVLFVNGIPLVVIECKRPNIKDAIEQGISQHLRNQKVDEIPHLYAYSQILSSLCQNKAKYGTTGTPMEFWSSWKEENPETEEIYNLINTRLPIEIENKILENRDDYQKQFMRSSWNTSDRMVTPQDEIIVNLLTPKRLLELIYGFVVFDNKEKKICRYQQYFAVKATLEKVKKVRGDSKRDGGVIWHTTGSGKSLTMVMLSKAIALEPSIVNSKVILVTDRVDLDDQIYGTFKNCGKSVKKANSGKNLYELIHRNKANIITTVIDKFEIADSKFKFKDESSNIFVLVDESHRSQYGVAHDKMRKIFPNACYIGFTGTPLLKEEKSTAQKFGGFIHKYTMNQAVKDGTVVPLIYEGRMCELRGDKQELDKWFERITSDLTEQQKADLKKKFRLEGEILKSDERLEEIAYDIGKHFSDNFKDTGKKGMFAVSSKEEAIRYKKCFEQFGDVSVDVIISPPDTRENHEDIDESNIPLVQQFWKSMMDKYGNEEKYLDSIIRAFKYSDSPELLIVVDKLLTGFDVKCNSVLYIDKRLKEHGILQAIARVNRVFDESKDFGLIVDYRGIFGELNDAIDMYAALENEGFDPADVEDTMKNIQEEIKTLSQKHTNLWEVFKEVGNKIDIEALQRHLEPEDIRNEFYEKLKLFGNTLQLALSNSRFLDNTSEDKLTMYKADLKKFLNLRSAVKQRYGETVNYSAYEKQIRNVVNKHIGADEVKIIINQTDVFQDALFDKEIEQIIGDSAKADTIAARIKRTITEKMEEDPAFYKKLSELIEETIKGHREKRLNDMLYLNKVKDVLDDLRTKGNEKAPKKLRGLDDAKAYFGVIVDAVKVDANYSLLNEDVLADAAIATDEIINRNKIRDWVYNQDVQNKMKNEIEDRLLALKDKYKLNVTFHDIDNILNDVLMIAKRREQL